MFVSVGELTSFIPNIILNFFKTSAISKLNSKPVEKKLGLRNLA